MLKCLRQCLARDKVYISVHSYCSDEGLARGDGHGNRGKGIYLKDLCSLEWLNGRVRESIMTLWFHCISFWWCGTAYRILAPRPGTEPGPQKWKRRFLTTGPPGNSHIVFLLHLVFTENQAGTSRGEAVGGCRGGGCSLCHVWVTWRLFPSMCCVHWPEERWMERLDKGWRIKDLLEEPSSSLPWEPGTDTITHGSKRL